MDASKPNSPDSARGEWQLIAFMVAAIAIVTALAWADERREAEAALGDLEGEQRVVASVLAEGLRGGPADANRRASFVAEAQAVVRTGELVVLVAPAGEREFSDLQGRRVSSAALSEAAARHLGSLRLPRDKAPEVGLQARMAVGGLAYVADDPRGEWTVAALASAARERDRDKRAQARLVLGVVVASCLVLAFGGVALRKERGRLELARDLAIAEAQRGKEEALARAARLATMGTFAMGVMHEVATPLGVIVGRAEQILERTPAEERVARNAALIMQQADRIQQVIRRFLDMARGAHPALERVDPGALARSAAAAVEHRFVKANVSLRTDVPSGLPALRCDRALLEHAIVNVVLNACEACTAGGRVDLAARADGESVAFVVTDDGVGISPADAARATEPFFTTKPEGVGTGLGLAIAAEIAKSHRGAVSVAPNAGGGTRVCIEIPIATTPGGANANT